MSTHAYQPALIAIANISKKEKLSITQQKELESVMIPLLSDSEGASAIVTAIQPIQWSRPVLRVLVNEATRQFRLAEKGNDQELKNRLGLILMEIASKDKTNSDARWIALASAFRLNLPQAFDALKQALQQLGTDAAEKYFKYALHSMSPDGGLPYLLKAMRLDFPSQLLRAVIEKVALEISKREQVAAITADAIRDAILDIRKQPATDYDGTQRAIIYLAVNVATKQYQLKEPLLDIRAELERTAWDASDWRHHLQASVNRLFSGITATPSQPTDPAPPEHLRRQANESLAPQNHEFDVVSQAVTKLDAAGGTVKTLLFDQQERIDRFRSDLHERNATIKDLKNSITALELQLGQTLNRMNEVETGRAKALEDLKQLQLEKQLIVKRAEQDVARAELEREAALTTFKATLWQELQPCLVEAQDHAHLPEQLSEESRIFLRRLRDVVYVLQKQGIH